MLIKNIKIQVLNKYNFITSIGQLELFTESGGKIVLNQAVPLIPQPDTVINGTISNEEVYDKVTYYFNKEKNPIIEIDLTDETDLIYSLSLNPYCSKNIQITVNDEILYKFDNIQDNTLLTCVFDLQQFTPECSYDEIYEKYLNFQYRYEQESLSLVNEEDLKEIKMYVHSTYNECIPYCNMLLDGQYENLVFNLCLHNIILDALSFETVGIKNMYTKYQVDVQGNLMLTNASNNGTSSSLLTPSVLQDDSNHWYMSLELTPYGKKVASILGKSQNFMVL